MGMMRPGLLRKLTAAKGKTVTTCPEGLQIRFGNWGEGRYKEVATTQGVELLLNFRG